MSTELVARTRIGLATGAVSVTVDASRNATYELVRPVT